MHQAASKIPQLAPPGLALHDEGDRALLEGALTHATLADARRLLAARMKQHKGGKLDLGKLADLDTPGALFLNGLRDHGLVLTGVHADHLIGRIGSFSLDPAWAIETARIAALLLFCLLVCFMTVVRRPQKAAARGLEPRVTALLATFMLPRSG